MNSRFINFNKRVSWLFQSRLVVRFLEVRFLLLLIFVGNHGCMLRGTPFKSFSFGLLNLKKKKKKTQSQCTNTMQTSLNALLSIFTRHIDFVCLPVIERLVLSCGSLSPVCKACKVMQYLDTGTCYCTQIFAFTLQLPLRRTYYTEEYQTGAGQVSVSIIR